MCLDLIVTCVDNTVLLECIQRILYISKDDEVIGHFALQTLIKNYEWCACTEACLNRKNCQKFSKSHQHTKAVRPEK